LREVPYVGVCEGDVYRVDYGPEVEEEKKEEARE
jgi:hypothetical protein